MLANHSKFGGTVIQGAFPHGLPHVLQALMAVPALKPSPAKAPLPFAGQPVQAKSAVQAKVITPPPVRFPNQSISPAQPKPAVVPPGKSPARFTVPLPTPVAQPKAAAPVAAQPKAMQLSGGGQAFQVPASLNLTNSGGGQRLPEAVQKKMEAFFGTSFDDVRVHVGPQAASIGALAFTHGTNLYFAPGQYNPTTTQGQQLLGHELTHVVQQRAGRVRNPYGSGVAVVQDTEMEAEAGRLGSRAASFAVQSQQVGGIALSSTHGVVPSLQAKGDSTESLTVSVSPPMRAGRSSYRIVAGAGGRSIGSVMIHARDNSAVEVTDLKVEESRPGQGLGGVLMASAMNVGRQLGRSRVVLASQDNGSGRLTRWYRRMGFEQFGVNRLGFPKLEVPINRVLVGVAQAKKMVSDLLHGGSPRTNLPRPGTHVVQPMWASTSAAILGNKVPEGVEELQDLKNGYGVGYHKAKQTVYLYGPKGIIAHILIMTHPDCVSLHTHTDSGDIGGQGSMAAMFPVALKVVYQYFGHYKRVDMAPAMGAATKGLISQLSRLRQRIGPSFSPEGSNWSKGVARLKRAKIAREKRKGADTSGEKQPIEAQSWQPEIMLETMHELGSLRYFENDRSTGLEITGITGAFYEPLVGERAIEDIDVGWHGSASEKGQGVLTLTIPIHSLPLYIRALTQDRSEYRHDPWQWRHLRPGMSPALEEKIWNSIL